MRGKAAYLLKYFPVFGLLMGCGPFAEPKTPLIETPMMPAMPAIPSCSPPADGMPPGPWLSRVGETARPDLALFTAEGNATLGKYYEPCAPKSRILLLRIMSAWCGPCRWHAAHTGELLDSDLGDRLIVQDILNTDDRNRVANVEQLDQFSRYYDKPPALAATTFGDSVMRLFGSAVDVPDIRTPLFVLIDTKSFKVLSRVTNPNPERLISMLRQQLAVLDGLPAPAEQQPVLYDGRFTRDRWEQIQQMALPQPLLPPLDPTNRFEADADAIALGKQLFNDTTLTAAGAISCATCHSPMTAFADARVTALGTSPSGMNALGDRNTPSIVGAAFSRFQFWDGRADSLWSQALGPFEADKEMSSNRLRVVRAATTRYGALYTKVFGAPPDLSNLARFPADARPGMAAWDAMADADRVTVNRAYSNLGKAIAAFERQVLPQPVAIDRYARGELSALTDDEKDGLSRFFEVGCIQCHHGPMLMDNAFHSMYFPTGRQDRAPDLGLLRGSLQLLENEFRGDGAFSDAPEAATWLRSYSNAVYSPGGHFKTPTLRGIADTAPYTHGGQVADLEKLVLLYARAGLPDGDPLTTGTRDVALVRFDELDPRNKNLAKFLATFKGQVSAP